MSDIHDKVTSIMAGAKPDVRALLDRIERLNSLQGAVGDALYPDIDMFQRNERARVADLIQFLSQEMEQTVEALRRAKRELLA